MSEIQGVPHEVLDGLARLLSAGEHRRSHAARLWNEGVENGVGVGSAKVHRP